MDNNINNSTEEQVKIAFYDYLDTYFVNRDLQKTIEKCNVDFIGFGTGKDETVYSSKDYKDIFKRDIEQAPNSIKYEIHELHIKCPLENVGIIACEISIQTEIMNQKIALNNLRITMVMIKNSEWLIENQHVSFPSSEHDEDESYPIKELEERNEVLKKLVNKKARQLEDANKLKSYFISKISHDIRNSLFSIKSLANLLKVELEDIKNIKDNSLIIENAELMDFASENMINLINDLTDLSRIETKDIKLQYSEFNLYKELNEIVRVFNKITNKKNNSFVLKFDENIPKILKGDKYRLNRIIQNLLINSDKFTNNGKIELNVFLLEEKNDTYNIQFNILDNGIGIEKDKFEDIFKPYYQIHEFNGTGSGLGLALCKELVELMNGRISVESEVNKGTKITFNIIFKKN